MYGDLVEQFSYHDITTYISIDGRDAVKATFQKVLDQACADKGVEIIKKTLSLAQVFLFTQTSVAIFRYICLNK